MGKVPLLLCTSYLPLSSPKTPQRSQTMCGLVFSRAGTTEFFLKASPCLGKLSALQSLRDHTRGTVGRTEWLWAAIAATARILLVEASGMDRMGKAVSKACWESSAQVKPWSACRQAVTQSYPTHKRMLSPQHGPVHHTQVKL